MEIFWSKCVVECARQGMHVYVEPTKCIHLKYKCAFEIQIFSFPFTIFYIFQLKNYNSYNCVISKYVKDCM